MNLANSEAVAIFHIFAWYGIKKSFVGENFKPKPSKAKVQLIFDLLGRGSALNKKKKKEKIPVSAFYKVSIDPLEQQWEATW